MQAALFDRLKAGVGELWDQAQQHPFVDALGDGTLAPDRFIHYLKQDYVYLTGYSRAIALASARAPDLKRMAELSTTKCSCTATTARSLASPPPT